MNNDVEKLLRSFEGPEPNPETTKAIFAAARTQAQLNARRTSRNRTILRLSVAAAACLLIGIAISMLLPSGEPAAAGTVASERLPVMRDGEQLTLHRDDAIFTGDILLPDVRSDVVLADGSSVRLDAGANLKLTSPGENMCALLELDSGRIFVRVAPAPGEFIVTGTGEIRVIGTAFGVEQRGNRMQVSVIEGAVALTRGGDSVDLKRGETGVVEEGAAPHRTGDDPNIKTRWARDAVHFDKQPLGGVIDWLTRNTSYRFTLPPEARDIRVSVAIGDEPIREIIDTLGIACGLQFSVDGNDVIMKE